MKKIKDLLTKNAWWLILANFFLFGVTASVIQTDRFLANQVYAIKPTDTTTLWYSSYGNFYFKKSGGDTTYWLSNGRTSGNKFFRVWPDTLVNGSTTFLGDNLLTNPSTGRFVWATVGTADSVTTSSTSITTIQTVQTTANSSEIIDVYITGELSDGSDAGYVKKTIYVKNAAGTVTVTTPTGQLSQNEGAGLGTPAYAFSASGTTVLIRVTAGNSTSTKWKCVSIRMTNIVTP